MSRPARTLTLRRLMALVAVLAPGLAILRHAVARWGTSEVMTIAPVVLLATNVFAWFRNGRSQVFWIGFGLAGWAYLMLSLETRIGVHLPTSRMLDAFFRRLDPPPPIPGMTFEFGYSWQDRAERFTRAGHSVLSLGFALLGGAGATILYPAKVKGRDESPPPDGSLLNPGWRDAMGHRS